VSRHTGSPNTGAYNSGMNREILETVQKLSPPERLELLELLWDSLDSSHIPVTAYERELIDQRIADAEANPDDQSPWEDVRARLDNARH
jgi:putative addiction module component (TIGR02574 family)